MTVQNIQLWEVFIRSRNGLAHKHVGSLHAADVTMALTAFTEPRFDLRQAILEGHQRYTTINAPVLAIVALPRRMRPRVASNPRQLAQWQTWEVQDAAQADAVERSITGARVVRSPMQITLFISPTRPTYFEKFAPLSRDYRCDARLVNVLP